MRMTLMEAIMPKRIMGTLKPRTGMMTRMGMMTGMERPYISQGGLPVLTRSQR